MAFERFNLDDIQFELKTDEELARLCLETDPSLLINPSFKSWQETKNSFDYRISWSLLSEDDQWSCYILEQLLWELNKVIAIEFDKDGKTNEREIDWLEIFKIIRIVANTISSRTGYTLDKGDIEEFSIRYYKFLMSIWGLSDDRDGITGDEGNDMSIKLAGEDMLHRFLKEKLAKVREYFYEQNASDGNDGGTPDVLVPVF